MSSNIYWEPADRKQKALPTALKWALRKRYNFPVKLADSDMHYLNGLCDAEVDGAQTLIDAIEKYGVIEITEVF